MGSSVLSGCYYLDNMDFGVRSSAMDWVKIPEQPALFGGDSAGFFLGEFESGGVAFAGVLDDAVRVWA